MKSEDLKKLKEKLLELSDDEKELRDKYLRGISKGDILGPMTGYASIDKPWLKYYPEDNLRFDLPKKTAYQYMYDENIDNLSNYAISYYGKKIRFKEFIELIDETARRLYNLGVINGDVVTVISVCNPEIEILFYALNKIGAVMNLVDVRNDYKSIKKHVQEVKSSLVVVMDNFLIEYDKAMDDGLDYLVEKVITISPYNSVLFPLNKLAIMKDKKNKPSQYEEIKRIKNKDKYMEWNELYSVPKYMYAKYPRYQENSLAVLVHTGGTTGVSKTVKLTNDNLNTIAVQYKLLNTGYDKGDTFLNGIVPFVAYGIVATIHMPMCLGITNIIAPILSPEEFTKFMIKYKPNHTITIPSYVSDFVNDEKAKKINFSSIKHLGVGGDSFSSEKEKEVNEFLRSHGSLALVEKGYGMTEMSSSSVTCIGKVNKLISLGIPLPMNNIGIFSEDGEELQYNQEGEVCITGQSQMLGYLNNSKEEEHVLKIHVDGIKWTHSGDLGVVDEDGFLFLKGRIKRMFAHGGFKIYPQMMENVIVKNQYVDDCCVIGIPSQEFGTSPEAHITLHENKISEWTKIKEELINLCQEELPEYSQPVDFILEDFLPLTVVGKVDYKKLEKKRCDEIINRGN